MRSLDDATPAAIERSGSGVASHLVRLVYLMAPAYVGNMAPPFVRFWRGWNPPISERWLGAHKTVLGALAGVIVALVVALIQSRVDWHGGSLVDYDRWPLIGALLGVGAIGGDAVKSFFKRRRGIPAGASWIPADQLDSVAGALILIQLAVRLSWSDVVLLLAFTFIGDIVVNHLSFRLGIRDTAW